MKLIKTEKDLEKAFENVDKLWGFPRGTPEGRELDLWISHIEKYEKERYQIPKAPVGDLIRYKMVEKGISQEIFLERAGWTKKALSEVLSNSRYLTQQEIKDIKEILGLTFS